MSSIFGHSLAAVALGYALKPQKNAAENNNTKLLLLGAGCACLPDLDILAFNFGIPYASIWGHRGLSHSILFAVLWGYFATWLLYRKSPDFGKICLYFVLCTLSHPILDACTTGGRGVALFFPITSERIFLPWKVIQVSPISPRDFFGEWGKSVLLSELKWVGIPSLILVTVTGLWRMLREE